jgi:hypothetical protein
MTEFCRLSILFLGFLFVAQVGLSQSSKKSEVQSTQNRSTQIVVSEGAGLTEKDALKNAFRNAVMQVVGAVVDAQTIVKDESIIDDSVLTYSDGFIKSFEEIDGSKSESSGLHRIRIKATVERKALIAKLSASNVAMISVDGQGMFAEVTSKLLSESDAAAMIVKQFEGFPNSCVSISILGKPETIEKTQTDATIRFKVQVQPDLNAFKAFRAKLIQILEKTAKPIGEASIAFKPNEAGYMRSVLPLTSIVPSVFMKRPNAELFSMKKEFALVVETSRKKNGDTVIYRGFKLEPASAMALRSIFASHGHAILKMTDSQGNIVATSKVEPAVELNGKNFGASLTSVFVPSREDYIAGYGLGTFDQGAICLIASMFNDNNHGGSPYSSVFLLQRSSIDFEVSIKLSHEELRSVKDAKVEISFEVEQ